MKRFIQVGVAFLASVSLAVAGGGRCDGGHHSGGSHHGGGDGHGWADRFTELAGNATLFTVVITTQRMQAPKTRTLRRFFFREQNRDLALKHVLARQGHALQQLDEHEARHKIFDRSD